MSRVSGANCPELEVSSETEFTVSSAGSFMVDNKPPGGAVTVQVGRKVPGATTVVTGDKLIVNFTGMTEAANISANLTHIGPAYGPGHFAVSTNAPADFPSGSGTQEFLVTETGPGTFTRPIVFVYDANGNKFSAQLSPAIPIDTDAPDVGLALSAMTTGQIKAVITRPVPNDVDNSGYQLTVSPVGALPAGCAGKPTSLTYQIGSASSPTVESSAPTTLTLVVPPNPASASDPGFPLCVSSPPTSYNVAVVPMDTNGNVGPTVSARIAPSTSAVTTTVAFTTRPPYMTTWPSSLGRTWASANAIHMNGQALNFTIQRQTDSFYWTGSAWVAPTANPPVHAISTVTPTDSTPSGHVGTFSFNPSAVSGVNNPASFPDGQYVVTARLTNPATGAVATDPITIHRDITAPTLTTTGGENRFTSTVEAIPHGQAATLRIDLTDGATSPSFANISAERPLTIELIDAETFLPARSATTGTPGATLVTCPSTACTVVQACPAGVACDPRWAKPFPGATTTHANLTFKFPDTLLGRYFVALTFMDNAGNKGTGILGGSSTPTPIKIVPRLAVGHSIDDIPSVDPFAGLKFNVYAAFGGSTSLDPPATCPLATCRVTTVELYGREGTTPETVTLGESKAPLLWHNEFPREGPKNDLVQGDSRYWWNYSLAPGQRLPVSELKNLNLSNLYVKAVAKAVNATGTSVSSMTDWIKVTSDTSSGRLALTPADNSTVFMFGNATSVKLDATFAQPLTVEGTPSARFTVRMVRDAAGNPVTAPRYVRFTGSQWEDNSPTPLHMTVTGTRPSPDALFYLNVTNPIAEVPPGEYVVQVDIIAGDGTADVLATLGSRMFGVQKASPVVTIDPSTIPQPEIYQDKFVGREFNLSFRIQHGFSNLSVDRINVSLLVSNVGGAGKKYLKSGGPEGFNATLRDFSFTTAATSTMGNFTVKLPPGVSQADIMLNATTDSWTEVVRAAANATQATLLVVDQIPPAVGVLANHTNQTGTLKSTPLSVNGSVSDDASGVQGVQVRLYDENASQTFDPEYDFGRGGWVPGLVDAWLSSDLLPYGDAGNHARHVTLALRSETVADWWVLNAAGSRPIIRLAQIDAVAAPNPTLGYQRTYDLTLTNLAGSPGDRFDAFALDAGGNAWRAFAIAEEDGAHAGKVNVTFQGLRMDASGAWRANRTGGASPVSWSVGGPSFAVNTSTHIEEVLKIPLSVNNVTGMPLAGTTGDVWLTADGTAGEPWYLYAPTGRGRGSGEFGEQPVATATAVAIAGSPGKVNVTFTSVKLDGAGIWRANRSATFSGQMLFVVPAASYGDLGLDRNHTYRVDVRGVDRVKNLGDANDPPAVVAFDVVPPVVTSPLSVASSPGVARPALAWHDGGKMVATIRDNHCVAAVQLVGTTPKGGNLTPANFTGPAGPNVADCSGAAGTWELDLSRHPLVTDEIGNYTYGIRVVDTAGNVVLDPRTVNATVQDRQRALVEFLRLEPPVAQVSGAQSGVQSVVAQIFENDAILDVRVVLQRFDRNGLVERPVGEGFAKPVQGQVAANGTGNWSLRTDELTFIGPDGKEQKVTNLSEGAYLWTVRARDVNLNLTCAQPFANGCHQAAILGQFSTDAPGFVSLKAPNATAAVGATPRFAWEVDDLKATQSTITVEQRNNATTFTKVSPDLAVKRAANGSAIGFYVNYTPPQPLVGPNVTMRVTLAGTFPTTAEWNWTVDVNPPNVTANVTGLRTLNNVTYATSSSQVTICASDNETAVAEVTYTINNEGQDKARTVTCATPVSPSGDDGPWTIRYRAKDLAGNEAQGSLTLTFDGRGPVINVAKHAQQLAAGGDEVILTVTDAGSGVDDANVTIHYAYTTSSSPSYTAVKMTKVAGGNGYRVTLPGSATQTGLKYYFSARDRLGNLGTNFSSSQPHVIKPDSAGSNLPPTLAITAPLPGATARGSVELKWLATDPDGDPVSITVALRDAAGAGDFLVRDGANSGSLAVDLSQKAAGAYTLVVTASDGPDSTVEDVTITVERGEVVECATCPPATVDANEKIDIAVQVNPPGKTVASVWYNVTLDGKVVEGGQMTLSEGVWTASFTPTQAGAHKVLVSAQYADGTSEAPREVSSFSVQSGSSAAFALPMSLTVLLVIAVLTVALAAYGAFVRWK